MYAKVFSQIFESSIAEDYLTRLVFMDMLVLADPTGIVDMTASAISRRTNVPLEIVQPALRKLAAPDLESRNPEHEGRRIALLDDHRTWGWQILNFEGYHHLRDENAKRQMGAERARHYRERKRDASRTVTPVTRDAALPSRDVTHPPYEDAYENKNANAGGAGGEAPASEGQGSANHEEGLPHEDCSASFSFSTSQDNSNDSAVPPEKVIHQPTSQTTPASTKSPAPPPTPINTPAAPVTARGCLAMPEPFSAPSPKTPQAAALPEPSSEPWDALDFAMTITEPFGGLEPIVLRRVVFYHWKIAKPYWSTAAARVDSPERLLKVLPKMHEQTPPDFRVTGAALIPLRSTDPNCKLCEGDGYTLGPNEAYEGELKFFQANPCSCVRMDNRPWRSWSIEAA